MSSVSQPRKRQKKGHSVSLKICKNILKVLIPSLVILIVVSCLMASRSISTLNNKILESQTANAVSIVDGFLANKRTAVEMFESNPQLQAYFQQVTSAQDMATHPEAASIVAQLKSVLQQLTDENVQQAWVASINLDTYMLSTGELVAAGLADVSWDEEIIATKSPKVTEPFLDPASGKQVISIVAPVLSPDNAQVLGVMGVDVFVENLSAQLSDIKIGKEGYMELLSSNSDYIYSDDPAAIGKNVTALDISDDYKNKVQSRFEGIMDFSYDGIAYTALAQLCDTNEWLVIATIPQAEVNATRDQLIWTLTVLSIVILVILCLIIFAVIRRLMAPLTSISNDMNEFSLGNLNVNISVNSDDEIGRMADSARTTITTLKNIISDISHVLSEIAANNLNVTVQGEYVGDFIPIREALTNIIVSLNETMSQINIAADEVSGGSDQVSASAQALSQGATEQASSVEELAATITEINRQINETAGNAAQASDRAKQVGAEVSESNERMQAMLAAMDEISQSSSEIGKIIKAIEDIAFQTNILALNAAVEAARAGVAGKGFAVVADEVRNLASKSAEASKSTAALIEDSLKAVANGTKIADETAQSLDTVVQGVQTVAATIDKISEASQNEADAISQVSLGVEQISSIVQNNSATAEESAAASEELNGQANMLKSMVNKFTLKDDGYSGF